MAQLPPQLGSRLALYGDDALLALRGAAKRQKPHPSAPQQSAADTVLSAADTTVDIAKGASEVTLQATLAADMLLPMAGFVAGGAAGLISTKAKDSIKNTLNAPTHFLHGVQDEHGNFTKEPYKRFGKGTLGGAILNGTFVATSVAGTYGVARGFFQKLQSLKQMYADMTGKDVKSVSTWSVLTAKAPPMVAEARDHLIKEHGLRGLVQAVGLALNARNLQNVYRHGKDSFTLNMITGFGAQGADLAIDTFMGPTPIVEIYKPLSDAHKRGEAIPAQVYAEFLMAASHELRRRGPVGMGVATKLAEQYAQEKTAPAAILKEIEAGEQGRFTQRVKELLAEAKAAQPSQEHTHMATTHHRDKLSGHKKEQRPVVGHHTQKAHDEQHTPLGRGTV